MKVLIIGSGGREDALAQKIFQSKKVKKIYCAPGNPGTARVAENIAIEPKDLPSLLNFVKKEKIDLTVVGPEAPLISGIVDLFEKNHLSIIGPSSKASQIEGSKIFAKNLMKKYGIPTANFAVFNDFKKTESYLKNSKYPLVIKADGCCLGKGVCVATSKNQALKFLKSLMVDKIFGNSGNNVIIEECLEGLEVSFMVLTDGRNFISLLPSQDHKRVFDNDKGPNTGGMGAYAPLPFVNEKDIERIEKEIVSKTIKALASEGYPYKGILYPGLILTKDGPKVLEFNCRFGDPETEPLLTLLQSDIIELFEAILKGNLDKIRPRWMKGSAVCVILASRGYPGVFEKGKQIKGLDALKKTKNIFVYHAGTKLDNGELISSSGRVLAVTAVGKNLKEARKNVYRNIGKNGVHFAKMHYRKDIGRKGLKS